MTGRSRRSYQKVLGPQLLGLGASMASADAPPPLRSVQAYDEFHDVTTLGLHFGPVYRGEHHEVEMGLTWFCKGRDRNSPVQGIRLRFVFDSSNGWVFLEYHPAALLVDGERFEFDSQYDGTFSESAPENVSVAHPTCAAVSRLNAVRSGSGIGTPPLMASRRAPPIDAGPVDRMDLIADAVRLPVVVDGLTTCRDAAIVVDDHVSADGELWIEVSKPIHRRFVPVAVEADDR